MRECDYCKREEQHGGECGGKWDKKPCLIFDRDPLGKIVYDEAIFHIPFFLDPPELRNDCDYYEINGVPKTIQFISIKSMEWHKDKTGLHGIKMVAAIRYWSDENGIISDKPKFKLIKGGAQCQE